MVIPSMSSLSSFRKQHLLVEFSSLKYACPRGVYMSLTPGDPTLWSGVLFVRQGPYSPSILRFQISFPASYPALPPLVTFSTEMFHPLITPLSTYLYSTDVQNNGTVSATDEERLPPGGFSLRHGFPAWFGRASRRSGAPQIPDKDLGAIPGVTSSTGTTVISSRSPRDNGEMRGTDVSIFEILRYMCNSFEDGTLLDDIPLEAAGNPGGWHAWRTHRLKTGKTEKSSQEDLSKRQASNGDRVSHKAPTILSATREPGEWNWEGVWAQRVKRGIEGSLADAVLFGSMTGDDLITFYRMDQAEVETVLENIKRTSEAVEPQRRGVV